MNVVGIDPGLDGAVALLIGGRLKDFVDFYKICQETRTGKRRLRGDKVAGCLRFWHDRHVIDAIWIESVHAMPGQGSVSGFSLGVTYGSCLTAASTTIGRDANEVAPQVWKKAAGVTADKQTSLDLAIELWPDHAAKFARKKDADRAEAALIARHGWLQMAGAS